MRLKQAFSALVGLFAVTLAQSAFGDVQYRASVDPAARTIRMRVELTAANAEELFQIPAWSPGYYHILEFQKQISDVRATNLSGEALKVSRSGDRGWKVQNPSKEPIIFTYRVFGSDAGLGFFGVHVGQNNAFINGAAGYIYAPNHMTEPHRAEFNLPFGWDIATSLPEQDAPNEVKLYEAANYDDLIDHPVQMGKFTRKTFTAAGIPFEAIWVSEEPIASNLDEETKRLEMGSLPAIKMFGGAPFKKYLYIIHLSVGDFAGGLEHRASCVLAVRNTPAVGLDDLATHEFFHAWNVKNIRPKVLGPFDYTQPVRTGNLWFAEGVTDYYSKLHAYQAGQRSLGWVLDSLSNEIEDLQRSQVRLTKSIEQACKETWESSGFGYGDLSFYTKGQLIGLIFDSAIRKSTKGQKSLNDVMRLMMSKYSLPKPGYEEDGILKAMNEVTGTDMSALYKKCAQSTEELPYDQLSSLGLRAVIPDQFYVDPQYQLDEAFKVIQVAPSIKASGLQEGDTVVSATVSGDSTIQVSVLRKKKPLTITTAGRRYKAVDYRLQIDPFATPENRRHFQDWSKLPEASSPAGSR